MSGSSLLREGRKACNNRVPFSSFSHLRYLQKFKCSALQCSLASTEFSSFNPIAAGLFLPKIKGGVVFSAPPPYDFAFRVEIEECNRCP